jgi:hypothetical protein
MPSSHPRLAARAALASSLAAAALAAAPALAAPTLPPADEVTRVAYPAWNQKTSGTGERGKACGSDGELTARLVAVRPWKGLGKDQLVAAFAIWVRAEGGDPADDEGEAEYAQACGPKPAQLFLLERGPAGLRVVARSTPDALCDKLDLAAYRILPGETLIGARNEWTNHGFERTTLTLFRVASGRLDPVAVIPIDSSDPESECHGVVDVVPRAGAPADLRVTWKRVRLDDDANEHPDGSEAATWRWDGGRYALQGKPGRCAGR